MIRCLGISLALGALFLFTPDSPTSNATMQPASVAKIMAEKLKASQVLLEGLALGDFAKISRSAEKLVQLTRTEEWMVYKTPRYEVHSNEFRRAAEMILQKSEKKNLDGVAYAYLDLTMTCVRCHQYVREVKDARLPGVNPEFLFARR
jgi:hypothetical protein